MHGQSIAGRELRAAPLAGVELWRLAVPLITPYRLAFGPQSAFDCVVVHLTDADGGEGWGEAALLPGYTDEDVAASWATAKALAPRLPGAAPAGARQAAEALLPGSAFTATAFLTALDQLGRHPLLAGRGRVPLLGTVNGKPEERDALAAEIEDLLATGYRTLKVKIGWDVERDLAAVRLIREIVAGRAVLRVDGNQGYARTQAERFVGALEPEGIELVEQPCAAGDWDAAVAVKRAARMPVMLDESIYGEAEIRRAAGLGCADYIKLKLMKAGSLDRLAAGLGLIRELGMRAVMGNGVATDLGCWMEAAVALEHLDNAGEMNGFLKPRHRLLDPPLETEGDCIVMDGRPRRVARAALEAVAVERQVFGAGAG